MGKNIAEYLLKWHYECDLNFIKLIDFINDNKIPITDTKLINSIGMATYYEIHIDFSIMELQSHMLRYFIILHEIGHYKRLKKKGLEFHLHNLSVNNVNELYKHILNEETIADNYAMFVYRKLIGVSYPYDMTQRVKEYENKVKFIETANYLLGKIQNNEDSYKLMIKQYILE